MLNKKRIIKILILISTFLYVFVGKATVVKSIIQEDRSLQEVK